MTEKGTRKTSEKTGKGGRSALVVCFGVIVVLACVIVFLLLNQNHGEEAPKRDVIVNNENAEKVVTELAEKERTPVGSYRVTMNSTWNFSNSASASDNAYVENSEANTNSVYFDVVRTDTNETILESPILPVGTYWDEITLDSELPAGTYDCVLTYHLLNENDEPISKVNVGLTIVVEK